MSELLLHEFHKALGARFSTLAGVEIINDYGDSLGEYRALTETAGAIDLSFRSRLCLTGADRARFLHGQVTNDIKALRPGQGCYAALVTAKGKMQSDLNIFCLPDELLLDFEPGLEQTISERLGKYIIADDVQIVEAAPHYGLFSVMGPKTAEVMRKLSIFAAVPLKPMDWVSADDQTMGLMYLALNPRLLSGGVDVFVPNSGLRVLAERLVEAVKSVGGCACGWQAFETARIEEGIPRFGADMDETNIPLEAGLENRALSFNKGCYIGQEVISRIRTYGQVAKALRRLRLGPGARPPAKGDKLFKDGKEAGYINSSVESPKYKAIIALAYVRKEVNQQGTELIIHQPQGEIPALVL